MRKTRNDEMLRVVFGHLVFFPLCLPKRVSLVDDDKKWEKEKGGNRRKKEQKEKKLMEKKYKDEKI